MAATKVVIDEVGQTQFFLVISIAFLVWTLVPCLTVLGSKHHIRAKAIPLDHGRWPKYPEPIKVEQIIEDVENRWALKVFLFDIPLMKYLACLAVICAAWTILQIVYGGVYYVPPLVLLAVSTFMYTRERSVRDSVDYLQRREFPLQGAGQQLAETTESPSTGD